MSGIKNVRTLTMASLLTALGIIAGLFKIPITNIIEIRFSSIPLAIAGSLFGPYVAGIVGIITDIGGFIIKPTGPYFPGFTLSTAISGVIFGVILRQRNGRASFTKIALAVLLNTIVVNLLMNSVWLTLLYGKGGFLAVLYARILKEVVMIPINIILIAAISKPVDMYLRRSKVTDNAGNDIQSGN